MYIFMQFPSRIFFPQWAKCEWLRKYPAEINVNLDVVLLQVWRSCVNIHTHSKRKPSLCSGLKWHIQWLPQMWAHRIENLSWICCIQLPSFRMLSLRKQTTVLTTSIRLHKMHFPQTEFRGNWFKSKPSTSQTGFVIGQYSFPVGLVRSVHNQCQVWKNQHKLWWTLCNCKPHRKSYLRLGSVSVALAISL